MTKTKRATKSTGGEAEESLTRTRIQFDFIKSHAFRVIHVDGVWGGMRPDSGFHLSLYNERHPIPRRVTLDLDPEDLESDSFVETEGRQGIIREVEVCAIMSLETAEELRDWLNRGLEQAREKERSLEGEDEREDGQHD